MEKSSRVNKYRNLRESLKEDATLPLQDIQEQNDEIDDTKIPTLREYRMKQFVQEVKDYENELDGVQTELESKEIEEAIGKVRMTSGKGQQYNTRLDILNHIQSGAIRKVDKTPIVVPPVETEIEDVKEEPIIESVEEEIVPHIVDEVEEVEPVKHFKIFFEDEEDEEDDEVVEAEVTEEIEKEEIKEKPSIFRRNKVFEEDEEDEDETYDNEDEYDDEEEEVGSSVTMKVLTGLIVVLSICLVALLGYIIKLFLF